MGLYRVDEMESLIRTTLDIPSQAHVTSATILQTINDAYKNVASRAFCIENEDTVYTVSGNRLVPFAGHKVTKVVLNGTTTIPGVPAEYTEGTSFTPGGDVSAVMSDNDVPPPFVASASSYYIYSDLDAWKAFKNLTIGPLSEINYWCTSTTGALPSWIKLDIGEGNETIMYSYSVKASYNARMARTWVMQGSNNDSGWTTIDTESNQINWGNGEIRDFTCDTITTAYRYFRMYITENGGDATGTNIDTLGFYRADLVPGTGTEDTVIVTSREGALKIFPTTLGYISIRGDMPQYWYQWGNYVVIEPVPDNAYMLTLFVSDYPTTELTATTDYPDDLPDEFQPCIVDFACYVLSLRMKKWKKAIRYYNLYIRNLKNRRQDYIDRKAEKRAIHRIPANVKYVDGRAWAH